MTAPAKNKAMFSPNLGLYYNKPEMQIPRRALVDGYNFRIKDGKINNYNLGKKAFGSWTLNGKRVMKIFTHTDRTNGDTLFFANPTDIFKYTPGGGGSVSYLTPRYQTGTVSRAATGIITGVGTAFLANVKIGDEIHFGAINFTDPTSTWDVITAVTDDTHITTSGALSVVGATVYTIRKLYVTGLPDWWDFQTFLNDGTDGKDRLFATNGVDWVQTWAFGDTQMTQQSGMAFKCKAIRPFSNMMQYGWLTSPTALPTSFINSDVGLPTHAGSLGTGLSEQFIAHDGTDGIDSFGILGNSLIIYSDKHIVGAQFVGDPEIFSFRKIDREVGPVGPFAVAEFGDYHEFIGADGAYRFDGVGATEIHSHVMRYVRAQMGPVRRKFTYSHFIDVEGEVIWSVPSVTDPGNGVLGTPPVVGWTEHYLEEVGPQIPRPFSKRNFPYTAAGHWTNATNVLWSDLTLTWADYSVRWVDQSNAAASVQELAGDETGQVWIINTVQDANGVNIDSYVQFPRFPTGNLREKSMLQRWYPFASPGIGNLTITTLYSNFATGVLVGDGGLNFDTTQNGNDFVSPMRKARYAALKISASSIAYQFEGYDYDVAPIEGGTR